MRDHSIVTFANNAACLYSPGTLLDTVSFSPTSRSLSSALDTTTTTLELRTVFEKLERETKSLVVSLSHLESSGTVRVMEDGTLPLRLPRLRKEICGVVTVTCFRALPMF